MTDEISDPSSPPTENATPSPITLKTSPETIAAEKVVVLLMTGIKNFGVFPPEHASTINMLQGILRSIGQFSKMYGTLSFDVEKQSLLYQKKVVYEDADTEENPAYVMNRAGISRFELASGLEGSELISFFQLYNDYQVMADEPDGDLVSALWRAGLPHIFYEASFDLWGESETAINYDALRPLPPATLAGPEVTPRPGGKSWEKFRLDSGGDNYRKVSLALLPGINDFCKLNLEEQAFLTGMIGEDTPESGSETVVRLMLTLLNRETDTQAHLAELDYLREVFLGFLSDLSFQRALFVLNKIREEQETTREAKAWSAPAYEKFYEAVLRPEVIGNLVAAWPKFIELGPQMTKALAAILQQLPPAVSSQLVKLLPQVEEAKALDIFIPIIAQHARQDQSVMEAGLSSVVEPLVLEMIAIIKERNDRTLVEKHLTNFRYDSRTSVRHETVNILISHNIY